MLIKSDLTPLPCDGRYKAPGREMGAGAALRAIEDGELVEPANVETAEYVAKRLEAAGNGTRADMVRRAFGSPPGKTLAKMTSTERLMASKRAPVPAPAESADAPSEAQGDAHRPPEPETPDVRALLDEAGEDPVKLLALAQRAGLKPSKRWGVEKYRSEIREAVARRVAAGEPALRL